MYDYENTRQANKTMWNDRQIFNEILPSVEYNFAFIDVLECRTPKSTAYLNMPSNWVPNVNTSLEQNSSVPSNWVPNVNTSLEQNSLPTIVVNLPKCTQLQPFIT